MSRERIEPGDPDFGVFTKVVSWHLLIESLPTWDEMIEIEKQLVNGFSLLGFTPADRTRLGLVSAKTKSKLEELLERKRNGN